MSCLENDISDNIMSAVVWIIGEVEVEKEKHVIGVYARRRGVPIIRFLTLI